MQITVIVPMYNEAANITATLEALKKQDYRPFKVVIADNASTDNSAQVTKDFISKNKVDWKVIYEPVKGTGSAVATAAETAIADGATHIVRTDSDCTPSSDWISNIVKIFETQKVEMIAGLSLPRTDDIQISKFRYLVFRGTYELAHLFSHLRPQNYASDLKGKYIMMAGHNMAITTELYQRVGGFVRTSIDQAHEDIELVKAVRKVTSNFVFSRKVIVRSSIRRIHHWGIIRSVRWYGGHYYKPENPELVDVR